jgi:predicted lipid-binding transport protein (Tim44 family)
MLSHNLIFPTETLMKKWLSLMALVMTLGFGFAHVDAEAKRLGGSRSFGIQRQAPPAKAPTNAATAAPAAGATAGAAGAAKGRSWMGPIAGLAAGLGLAALASHLGFGEGMANMLMIGLLVMAAIAAFRFFAARNRPAASSGGMAYAGAAGNPNNAFRTPNAPSGGQFNNGGSMIGSAIGANGSAPASNIPADFDVAGFERNAKVNFIRLQAANDTNNLDDIRAFTTPEMFAELKMDLAERGSVAQTTDVVRIEAEVINVEEESGNYVVSVRFIGETRDNGAAMTEAFDEVWHLTKPRQGAGGWILAGIQQVS